MNERYYRVGPRFWSDAQQWTDDAKLLALYVLTCPHRRLEGIFRLPKAYILADLNWSTERFAEPFAELLSRGFLAYDEERSIVLILRALKWQSPDNPNQVKSAVKAIAELPQTPLLSQFQELAKQFSQRLAEGLAERFPEGFAKPPSPSPSPTTPPKEDSDESSVEPARLDDAARAKRERSNAARQLFDYWREKCDHPTSKFTGDRKRKVEARLKDGYTVEQIQRGIEGAAQAAFVNGDGKKFDDLELICRSGSKLEGFIDRVDDDDGGDFIASLNARRQ